MAFVPRYYQNGAVDAIFDYWLEEAGHPLVDMAGGSGKSGTMAMVIKRLIDGWPDMRVLSCVHVEELVGDNFKELIGIMPFAPAGIFAASLGKRDSQAQIIFAQLQTIWNRAREIGHIDVMIIDEVHLVPRDGNTMYRKLIAALLEINPDMKLVGFSATVYRLDSGRLDEGDDRLFDRVVFTYSLAQGIEDGYLSRLTSRPVETSYDMSGVKRLGGDFKKSDLAKATDKEELTKAAVAEIMAAAHAENRGTAVIFCNGIDHATHVRDEVRLYGKSCEVLSGNTPKTERRKIIADLKARRLWGVTNDNVLSTGTNIPCIDLVADLAPTESTNRYVQRAVRGTRVVWPAGFNPDATDADGRKAAIARGPKQNCRYMNFAGNIERHGPVDCVTPKVPGSGQGEAPIKICMQCEEICHASVRVCPNCGNEFIFEEKPKFAAKPTDVAVLASEPPEWRPVTERRFDYHEGKGDKPPSVKVSYTTGMTAIREWLCPQHQGFAKNKANRWWSMHGGQRPFPDSVMAWLERQSELLVTDSISVAPDGKYWTIKDVRPGTEKAHDNDNERADNDNYSPGMQELIDDDIPF